MTDRDRLLRALSALIADFDQSLWRSDNWRGAARDRAIEETREGIVYLVARAKEEAAPQPSIDIETARADAAAGSQDLLEWPRRIAGLFIERPELDILLRRIGSEPRARTLVVGEAGAGKSALLSELAERLQSEGLSVFAIKADMLPPDVKTMADLSKALGLKGDLEEELDLLARAGPLVLIIDQLDAVSEVMDRSSQRMRLLLRLANRFRGDRRESDSTPPVHVVVSSRPFEAAHDGRFQTLQAETIKLGLPSFDKVEALLVQLETDPAEVPAGLRETLRRPFALRLFVDLVRRGTKVSAVTATELLDAWLAGADLGGPEKRPGVIAFLERLAADMTEQETLWRPADVYDAREPDAVRQSEASGLVVRQDRVLGFSHQSWLDDFQAKGLANGGQIAEFVLERQDGLFARTTVLRSLQRLRNFDPDVYGQALDTLLGAAGTRRHIRHLIVDLMASQEEPTGREQAWVQRIAREDAALARRALFKVSERWEGWREAILPMLPTVMANPALRWSAAQLLVAQAKFDLSSTCKLVRDHWADPAFDADVFQVYWRAVVWNDSVAERLQGIFERQSIQSYGIASYASDLAKRGEAAAATELVKLFLGSGLLQKRDRLRMHGIKDVVEAAPIEFAEALLPWFLGVATEGMDEHPPARERFNHSTTLPYTWDEDEHEDSVFHALKSALISCATEQPERCLELVAQIAAHPIDELQALAAEIYASNPATLAREGLQFLLQDDRRLCVGHANVQDVNQVHHLVQGWSTHLLIKAVVPHLTNDELTSLRDQIEQWEPYRSEFLADCSVKDRRLRRAWSEESRLELLEMLPRAVVGARRARQAVEWRADRPKLTAKRGVMASRVRSPMSADQMAKATDDDLVGMLNALPDGTSWEDRRRSGRAISRGGDVSQLGQAFATFGKANPDRAIRIVRERLQPNRHQYAVGALLNELGKVEEVQVAPLLDLICELSDAGYDSPEWRNQVAWALDALGGRGEGLADREVELLESWLCDDPAATERQIAQREMHEELNRQRNADRSGDDKPTPLRPVFFGNWGGLNIRPQNNFTILGAVFSGLVNRPEGGHDLWLEFLERHLARAEDPAIWAAILAYRGRWLYWADRPRAKAFLDALWDQFPQAFDVLAVKCLWPCRAMMSITLRAAVLQLWSTSDDAHTQQAAGEYAMALSIVDEDRASFEGIAQQFLEHGPQPAKLGCLFSVASAWRHNDGEARTKSHELLMQFAPTATGDDAEAVSTAVDGERTLPADAHSDELLRATVANSDLLRASLNHRFVDALQELLLHPGFDDLVLTVAEHSANMLVGQKDRRGGMIDGDLVAIAVALQRSSGPRRTRAMDLYEQLLDAEVYGADQAAAASLRH